jgi:hypothetical protein
MKDSRLKYLEISETFNNRATSVALFCKRSQKICELLANRLATKKVKTPAEFENNEYWKNWILETSRNNQETIELLDYMKGLLVEVLEDSKVLMDGAVMRDRLNFAVETIEAKQLIIDKIANEVGRRDTANT